MSRKQCLWAAALLTAGPLLLWGQRGRFGGERDVVPDGSRVEYHTFQSEVLGRDVPYALYRPPSYATSDQDYPVIFFLHGANENERRWSTRGRTDLMLDEMIAAGEIGEFIVAIPYGANSFYTNSLGGERWEDMVVEEFVPMSGISMGGYGALKLAMKHPDMFSSVSAHSAMLLDSFEDANVDPRRAQLYTTLFDSIFGISQSMEYWDLNNPLRMARESSGLGSLEIYFDCGTEDEYGFFVGAAQLDEILTDRNIGHEFHLYPGTHGWDYASQHTAASLQFHWRAFSGG
jgi:S-formylglutathione hydrolase FrmB